MGDYWRFTKKMEKTCYNAGLKIGYNYHFNKDLILLIHIFKHKNRCPVIFHYAVPSK